jgi:hypothetical protein
MTDTNLSARLAVRDTLDRYMACIDLTDWEGVAACFAPDAQSLYNNDPTVLIGGREVARFIQRAIAAYASTVHDLGNCRIEVDGASAHAASRALIGVYLRETQTASIRAISYDDELHEIDGSWLITRRRHEPLWQFDAPAVAPLLVMS